MAEYLRPDVYVEDIPNAPVIEAVSSSTGGFMGIAERGKINKAVFISSWNDYLRDVALSGTNVVYASKSDGTAVADRKSLDSTCKIKVSTIKDAIEILATNNAPKVNGESWIAFVHPHQSRDLRDDPAWINASNYGAPTQLFTGEIGRIDDVRFIETTILCNGKAAEGDPAYNADLKTGQKDNKTDVFQAVLFGDAFCTDSGLVVSSHFT
jgi:N4-gp56 family major capsid protein